MKSKKFLRQQSEKEQNKLNKQKELDAKRKTVVLRKDNSYLGNYRWKCPDHDGTYSWSKQINAQWGHPDEYAFCAVCFVYHNIEFEE